MSSIARLRPLAPALLAAALVALVPTGAGPRAQTKPTRPTMRTPVAPPRAGQPASTPGPQAPPNGPAAPGKPTGPAPATGPAGGAPPTSAPPAAAGDEALEDSDLYRCKKYPKNARIKVTLKPETELKDLVTWVMGFTCKNFIYGSGIAGRSARVTVIAPSEMSPADAYELFLVALQTMNLTVVPKGKTMEIIEAPRARESPIPVYQRSGAVPSSDQIVRLIVRPEFVSVDDMTQVLAALKSKDGLVTPLPNSGIILVTDTGNSIDRMTEVAREIDEPTGGDKIYIIRLRYADAVEMASRLGEIFGTQASGAAKGAVRPSTARPARTKGATTSSTTGDSAPAAPAGSAGGGGDATPTKIIADERINALIVVASERAYARILALVRRLDIAIEGGEGVIHVYPLENADAEELAGTLSSLISGSGATGRTGTTRPGGAARPQPSSGGGASSGTTEAFEGQVRITHDKPTNSLVIVSSVKDYFSLRDVIRKLDVPRRQVFVEATILEVSLDKSRQLGLSYHGGKLLDVGGEDALLFGGVQHTQLSSLILSPESFFGLAAGVRGSEIPGSEQLLGISVPAFGVMFQILQNNNDVNVLSSPHILTTDNEPAEIEVGQNIPFQGGITSLAGFGGATTGTGASSFGFPMQSIQRQDVTLKLKITPHVNESDFVRLEIEQNISDIASRNFEGLGPSWTKRMVKTMIVVKDQQPVVIGGLMSDKVIIEQSKVPLLGDIPILGYLFKYEQKSKQKTNLLIFLTPYIIKDPSDIRKIFEQKMAERREFIETFTAFDERDFSRDIDYTRKRGLLEDINKAIVSSEEEERILQEAADAAAREEDEGPVEMPDLPSSGGGAGGGGGDAGGGAAPPTPVKVD